MCMEEGYQESACRSTAPGPQCKVAKYKMQTSKLYACHGGHRYTIKIGSAKTVSGGKIIAEQFPNPWQVSGLPHKMQCSTVWHVATPWRDSCKRPCWGTVTATIGYS